MEDVIRLKNAKRLSVGLLPSPPTIILEEPKTRGHEVEPTKTFLVRQKKALEGTGEDELETLESPAPEDSAAAKTRIFQSPLNTGSLGARPEPQNKLQAKVGLLWHDNHADSRLGLVFDGLVSIHMLSITSITPLLSGRWLANLFAPSALLYSSSVPGCASIRF